ncbi:Uncharacterized protein APZ42_027495 [Daphnia magna]|uniref:Transmembrane protein n=1 Tax=Daphnia magna TaxID=35525 RepID=A0A164RMA8_9CRUS|nr:Uncharacterized protein APZ42_027495 [Daphnia magna]
MSHGSVTGTTEALLVPEIAQPRILLSIPFMPLFFVVVFFSLSHFLPFRACLCRRDGRKRRKPTRVLLLLTSRNIFFFLLRPFLFLIG